MDAQTRPCHRPPPPDTRRRDGRDQKIRRGETACKVTEEGEVVAAYFSFRDTAAAAAAEEGS